MPSIEQDVKRGLRKMIEADKPKFINNIRRFKCPFQSGETKTNEKIVDLSSTLTLKRKTRSK